MRPMMSVYACVRTRKSPQCSAMTCVTELSRTPRVVGYVMAPRSHDSSFLYLYVMCKIGNRLCETQPVRVGDTRSAPAPEAERVSVEETISQANGTRRYDVTKSPRRARKVTWGGFHGLPRSYPTGFREHLGSTHHFPRLQASTAPYCSQLDSGLAIAAKSISPAFVRMKPITKLKVTGSKFKTLRGNLSFSSPARACKATT